MTPAIATARTKAIDFVELTKPGVVLMVLVTTAAGFYLGSAGDIDPLILFQTLIGTALAAAGALALNQFLERDLDKRMERTRHRPLADGRLDVTAALGFGVLTAAAGPLYLTVTVNTLAGILTAVIVLSYLFVYTPLKQRTPLCTLVGAVPGALPPLVGMAAARGALGVDSCVLFAILFLWQIPHSLAVAQLYRNDYARAGVCFLPAVEGKGRAAGVQAVVSSLVLLGVAMLPPVIGLAGSFYSLVALTLGLGFLGCSVALAVRQRAIDASRLLLASLLYLPLLLTAMAFDIRPPVNLPTSMAEGTQHSLREPRSCSSPVPAVTASSQWSPRGSWEAAGHLITAVLTIVAVGCGSASDVDLPPVLGSVPAFTLVERSGRQVRAADLEGHIWVANFIFTRCPSICPGLSARMAVLQDSLRRDEASHRGVSQMNRSSTTPRPETGDEVRLVSFSVDPEHDTAEVLRLYADRFRADPDRWLFLTGPRAAIHELVRNGFRLGIDELQPGQAEGASGPIIHSDRFVLVDRALRIRGYYPGMGEDKIAELMQHIARLRQETRPPPYPQEGT